MVLRIPIASLIKASFRSFLLSLKKPSILFRLTFTLNGSKSRSILGRNDDTVFSSSANSKALLFINGFPMHKRAEGVGEALAVLALFDMIAVLEIDEICRLKL